MHCKRCGKAIGTDRGICPFCGAMLTSEQMKIYEQDKKDNMKKVELITEKYGNERVYFEKSNQNENKLVGILVVLGVLVLLAIIALIIVLNQS